MNDLPPASSGSLHPAETTAPDQAIMIARVDLLERLLLGSAIVASLGVLARLTSFEIWGIVIYGLAAGILFVLRSQSWALQTRSLVFLGVIYLLGVAALFLTGLGGSAALFLAAVPPVAILLLGSKAGPPAIALSLLTWFGASFAFHSALSPAFPQHSAVLRDWILTAIDLLMIIVILVQFLGQFRETQDYVVTVAQQNRDLQDTRAELTSRTKQLDYERYLLHTLLDTVSDKIYFKDLSGRYTRISQAVAQEFHVSPDQVIGKTDFDFYTLEYAQQVQADERQMLEDGQPIMDQVERETWRDGRPDSWSINSRLLLKGEDGKVTGWFGTARDITEIKQAQEADRRHAQQLAAVAEVSRAVTSSLDIRTLLGMLVELLHQLFSFYGVNVWLAQEGGDVITLQAGFSPAGEDLSQAGIQLPLSSTNSIVTAVQTGDYCLDNQLADLQTLPLPQKYPQARAQLVLPLRVAGKMIGVLEILSDQADAFADEDVILLRSLADQGSIAIRNATLYQVETARRRFAETLYEIGRALASTLNLKEVLDLILKGLDEIVPTDQSALMLLEGSELVIVAGWGFPPEEPVTSLRIAMQGGDVFERIYSSKAPVPVADVSQHPDWRQFPGGSQVGSWLGVPLIRSDEVVGVLSLVRATLDPFTPSEVTLAQTYAGQAALALENARLYDNLARFNQQLEEMVQARTEELRRAYDRLERMDRTKSDFIQVTSHELRTPLTVLQGYSQMLMQQSTAHGNAELSQLANGIYSGAGRLHEIVNSMLDIAKIDSRSLDLSPTPLPVIFMIKNVVGNFETALLRRNLSLVVENLNGLPNIDADAEALQKVFYHLIGNAIKYTPDGGRITISGRYLEPDVDEFPQGGVEIVISDTGIGIDPDEQELIFTKFYQTGEVALHSTGKTKFKGGGPGLGLPIARGIIQAHHGRLWVESPGHDETTCLGSHFHIALPVRQNKPADQQSDEPA
ncbi:MAG: GAF domain-containing protein [Anaerolineales bacterium]|nr:GAF domain-containing protein [Anaerolineales bacterium]